MIDRKITDRELRDYFRRGVPLDRLAKFAGQPRELVLLRVGTARQIEDAIKMLVERDDDKEIGR